MNKRAYIEDIYNSSFNDELKKIAKIRVGDIEDSVGGYLSDSLEEKARDLIAKETSERFAVRHPWLTGLPTLGIWPLASKMNAVDKITTSLARKSPEVRDMIRENIERQRAIDVENQKLSIERDKANQLSNMVTASALPIGLAMSSMREKEKDD